MKITKITLFLLSVSLLLTGCKKDKDDVSNPVDINETELITTIKLQFTDPDDVITTFMFQDLDGDGPIEPSIDTIRLKPATAYQVTLLVLDETKDPTDTTSNEIEKEKNEHQFFYNQLPGDYGLTFTDFDTDDNDVPLGLNFKLNTGTVFTDKTKKLRVTLKHQPEVKPTAGTGDMTLGETDVDVYFPILIQ